MKIIILFADSFPFGGSATNRVIHIAKMLIETGNQVKLICIRGTENNKNVINKKISGIYESIGYEYITGTVLWPDRKIMKVLEVIKGIIASARYLFFNNKEAHIDYVISYGEYGFIQNVFFYMVCRCVKTRFAYAVDEYPWCLIQRDRNSAIYRLFYISWFYRLFDDLLVITEELIQYYSDKVRKTCRFFHLPMTVEVERFVNVKIDTLSETIQPYIAYCGGESEFYDKDGVGILIEAFSIISSKYQELQLCLIGKTNQSWINHAQRLNISDKVIFTGKIHRNDIPRYLAGAKLLALARPNNLQAKGGFPSKLGEYLATGIPVVVTNVGEIPRYLTDSVNAFICEPGDPKKFAVKIDEVLSDQKKAQDVGMNGRETALRVFHYQNYSEPLHDFLKTAMPF